MCPPSWSLVTGMGIGPKVCMLHFVRDPGIPWGRRMGLKMLNNVLWLPNLVRRTHAYASLRCWWPQRSKVIRGQMWETLCFGYHIWSKEPLIQAKSDDDLHCGQRSAEVKYSKLCSMATEFGQRNRWCKFRMMITFTEVKGQQNAK